MKAIIECRFLEVNEFSAEGAAFKCRSLTQVTTTTTKMLFFVRSLKCGILLAKNGKNVSCRFLFNTDNEEAWQLDSRLSYSYP